MLGTYLLVFFGPGSVVVASVLAIAPDESLVLVAAVFGGTVGFVIVALGRFSGAHINPAITIGGTVAGLFKRELFLPYLLFQMVGGFLAGLSLRLAFGTLATATNLGSTELAAGVSPIEGVVLEAVGTFVLASSALVAASSVKDPRKQAVLVGGTLFVLILFVGPLTGASFNPARSFGPSLFSGHLGGQLVYYVGPVLGATCAGLIFGVLRESSREGNASKNPGLVCVC